jgi:hypothetical protein
MKLSDMKVGQKVSAMSMMPSKTEPLKIQYEDQPHVGVVFSVSVKDEDTNKWSRFNEALILRGVSLDEVDLKKVMKWFEETYYDSDYESQEPAEFNAQQHKHEWLKASVAKKTAAASSDLVITQQKGGPIQFWSGSRWVSEYPDAEKYPDMKAAKKANLKAHGDIMENYGMDDERVVGENMKLAQLKIGAIHCVKAQEDAGNPNHIAENVPMNIKRIQKALDSMLQGAKQNHPNIVVKSMAEVLAGLLMITLVLQASAASDDQKAKMYDDFADKLDALSTKMNQNWRGV